MQNANFNINGLDGIEDLHARLQEYPNIAMAKSDKTLQLLGDSDRAIVVDNHSYSGRTIDLKIVIEAKNSRERSQRQSKLYSAFNSDNYIDFKFYGEPEYTYKVINADVVSQERASRMSFYSIVGLKLNAQPYKYLNYQDSIEINGATSIFNDQFFPSRPLIYVDGASTTEFSINDKSYKFQNLTSDGVYIDCAESQQSVYNVKGQLIYNAYDMTQEFPELQVGLNEVTGTGLKIFPRWRTI